MDTNEKQKFIFASIFLLANKLQVLGDSYLANEEMTTKQWFLIVIISQFEKPPMLTEVANLMGSSRQNVKQLALKLQENGFLNIERDKKDGRTLRLKLTEKNQRFWDKKKENDMDFILDLFKCLSQEEINTMYDVFNKLLNEIK
jgi:DNA-binding MarR family transcriptional regulator